jgi:hypothetical protein
MFRAAVEAAKRRGWNLDTRRTSLWVRILLSPVEPAALPAFPAKELSNSTRQNNQGDRPGALAGRWSSAKNPEALTVSIIHR